MQPLSQRIDVGAVVANSFKDYHVKGFDYFCLKRTETETVKIYFFDGDVTRMPEVVNPHDHRYDFETVVLAGASENVWYQEDLDGRLFHRWHYDTPLNGGNGFMEGGYQRLKEVSRRRFDKGGLYGMRADEVHTIRIVDNETVLMLRQYEDKVPVGIPTQTFTVSETPPDLNGLYSRFTADQAIARLTAFEERSGIVLTTLF